MRDIECQQTSSLYQPKRHLAQTHPVEKTPQVLVQTRHNWTQNIPISHLRLSKWTLLADDAERLTLNTKQSAPAQMKTMPTRGTPTTRTPSTLLQSTLQAIHAKTISGFLTLRFKVDTRSGGYSTLFNYPFDCISLELRVLNTHCQRIGMGTSARLIPIGVHHT